MQERDMQEWMKICSGYFDSHTKQRFSFINFYIIISTALLYSINLLKEQKPVFYWIVIFAHVFELIITFIFYRLDLRSKYLLDNSKRVLKNIEKIFFKTKESERNFALYNHEAEKTKDQKNNRCCNIIKPITYRECFRTLFVAIGVYSLSVILFAGYYYIL